LYIDGFNLGENEPPHLLYRYNYCAEITLLHRSLRLYGRDNFAMAVANQVHKIDP